MRNKLTTAMLEAKVFKSGRHYLEKEGFIELFTPRIVRASGACENVNTLFEVTSEKDFNWFGEPKKGKHQAYLAQTGQLYLEAFVPYLKKTYCVGPSFRAEAGNDDRHLTEFQMMEIEFAGTFQDLLRYIEGFVYNITQDILKLSEEEQATMGLRESDLLRLKKVQPVFPKITYTEAIEKLGLNWGDDIGNSDEQKLVEEYGGQPLLITHYPDPLWNHGKKIEVEKFFNMIPDPEIPGLVLSADFVLPIAAEAVGSAARVDDHETLVYRLENSRMFNRLQAMGGSMDDFAWYVDKVKEKCVPHAGCGFGMSRILKWINGADSIKKAVTFPSNQHC